MRLLQRFAKACNRVAHDLSQSRGFALSQDPKGQPVVNLHSDAKTHKVFRSGKVRTSPKVLSRLGLEEVVEAAKSFASPRIQMLVRAMERQAAAMQPQLAPAVVRKQQPIRRNRSDM
jgi:hypothetical protein